MTVWLLALYYGRLTIWFFLRCFFNESGPDIFKMNCWHCSCVSLTLLLWQHWYGHLPSSWVIGSRYKRLPSRRERVCPLSLGVFIPFSIVGFVGCRTWSEIGLGIMEISRSRRRIWRGQELSHGQYFQNKNPQALRRVKVMLSRQLERGTTAARIGVEVRYLIKTWVRSSLLKARN